MVHLPVRLEGSKGVCRGASRPHKRFSKRLKIMPASLLPEGVVPRRTASQPAPGTSQGSSGLLGRTSTVAAVGSSADQHSGATTSWTSPWWNRGGGSSDAHSSSPWWNRGKMQQGTHLSTLDKDFANQHIASADATPSKNRRLRQRRRQPRPRSSTVQEAGATALADAASVLNPDSARSTSTVVLKAEARRLTNYARDHRAQHTGRGGESVQQSLEQKRAAAEAHREELRRERQNALDRQNDERLSLQVFVQQAIWRPRDAHNELSAAHNASADAGRSRNRDTAAYPGASVVADLFRPAPAGNNIGVGNFKLGRSTQGKAGSSRSRSSRGAGPKAAKR